MKHRRKILEFGISRADPLPDLSQLKKYYENKYYQNADGSTTYEDTYSEEELKHKALEAAISLEALKDKNYNSGKKYSLLELGCGEGFFLNEVASSTSWDIQGVDFSEFGIKKWHPSLVKKCLFGDSQEILKEHIAADKKFDICVLRNIVEHIIDPVKLLTELKKVLNKNGVVLITVPNDYSLLQEAARKLDLLDDDFWFSPPDHLYYYNTSNIIDFSHSLGYQVIDSFSSFPVDMFLFHEGSNYSLDKTKGKSAHLARVKLDLLIAQSGVKNILDWYRSMFKCGIGRDITVILTPNLSSDK